MDADTLNSPPYGFNPLQTPLTPDAIPLTQPVPFILWLPACKEGNNSWNSSSFFSSLQDKIVCPTSEIFPGNVHDQTVY
jgi:hypothetical protein